MSDTTARIPAWLTRLSSGMEGRHRRRQTAARPPAWRQYEGLAALLGIAQPTPASVLPRRRAVIPIEPAADPILMDGSDPRRYRFVRAPYRHWEQQSRSGDVSELAGLVRQALSMGLGR